MAAAACKSLSKPCFGSVIRLTFCRQFGPASGVGGSGSGSAAAAAAAMSGRGFNHTATDAIIFVATPIIHIRSALYVLFHPHVDALAKPPQPHHPSTSAMRRALEGLISSLISSPDTQSGNTRGYPPLRPALPLPSPFSRHPCSARAFARSPGAAVGPAAGGHGAIRRKTRRAAQAHMRGKDSADTPRTIAPSPPPSPSPLPPAPLVLPLTPFRCCKK